MLPLGFVFNTSVHSSLWKIHQKQNTSMVLNDKKQKGIIVF